MIGPSTTTRTCVAAEHWLNPSDRRPCGVTRRLPLCRFRRANRHQAGGASERRRAEPAARRRAEGVVSEHRTDRIRVKGPLDPHVRAGTIRTERAENGAEVRFLVWKVESVWEGRVPTV